MMDNMMTEICRRLLIQMDLRCEGRGCRSVLTRHLEGGCSFWLGVREMDRHRREEGWEVVEGRMLCLACQGSRGAGVEVGG